MVGRTSEPGGEGLNGSCVCVQASSSSLPAVPSWGLSSLEVFVSALSTFSAALDKADLNSDGVGAERAGVGLVRFKMEKNARPVGLLAALIPWPFGPSSIAAIMDPSSLAELGLLCRRASLNLDIVSSSTLIGASR